jgi:hypothetical protein
MKIILLATWPNGQTQHIYSTSSRLIAKSQHNAKLNRHVIEVTGPDAKFLSECIWHPKAMTPAVPVVVDENYNAIPLGSELGPVPKSDSTVNPNVVIGKDESGREYVVGIYACVNGYGSITPPTTNEPNQKESLPPVESVRQDVSEPRELPVLPEQPSAQAPEADAQDDVTVDDEDPEADMPLEEIICKRISEYQKLKVNTLASNLGVTADAIKAAVKKSGLLKITGTKNLATVSAK